MVNQAQAMNFFHFDNQNRAFYVDDKYKKLEQQERAEERRKIMWLCVKGVIVIALVGGVLFFLNQQYEKLKSKMLESPVVSLYLSNGCRGERIDISQVSGRQRQRGTMQVREVSFCDLQFADNVPANDQIRSILVRPGNHIVLYEHCYGPDKHKEKLSNGETRTVGPHKALGPPLTGGWMKYFSKCHNLQGRETQASLLDLYRETPPADL